MATRKRNPLFVQYEKYAALIRKNAKEFTDYNYTVPETHLEIKARMQLVKDYITEMQKILTLIQKERTAFTVPVLKETVKKKITDETQVNLKYRGFDIVTYKGKGGIWIAEATHPNGTMFVIYSKPTEIKTAVEKIQEKIRKYLKK